MKTKFLGFIAASFLIIISVVLINKVFAQETTGMANIQYPIKELENCKDKAACASYCDKPENITPCLNFAEKNNLMSKEEINTAKKFTEVGNKGPGNCKTKDACETYCDDISHIDECISFAEKNDLMPPKKLEEAKKVQKAIANGVKPPSCGNKKSCDAYCESPDHMEECIKFGEAAGFLQGKELEDSKKMLAAVKKGIKPPPCKGKDECDTYCSDPKNMEVCMTFAMEAGFMSEQEKANSQKMLAAVKKGINPPNCKGKDECDAYCSQEEHFDECTNFAEAAGFMNADEAAMARKTKGKGPGDCKGKNECETFCNNPDNQETCFNFAKENGLMSETDLKQIEEGKQNFKESFKNMPAAVTECLTSRIGAEKLEKIKNGELMPPKEIGDVMSKCFEKMGPPPESGQPGAGGFIPPAGQAGPGGCKTPDECKAYCETNPEECKNFQPGPDVINPGGQTLPPQAGPGGCKTPDECKNYCEKNPQECQNSTPPAPNGGAGQYKNSGSEPSAPVGNFQKVGPNGCRTPEECQNYQQPSIVPGNPYGNSGGPDNPVNNNNLEYPKIDQAPSINPTPCQGENCQYGPPPGVQIDQQPPSSQPSTQQPPNEIYYPNPSQSQISPDSQQNQYPQMAPPVDQQPPSETYGPMQPQQQISPDSQQNQYPQMAPTDQQPPAESPTPPPPGPSSKSESFLGSLLNIINKLFNPKK